MSLETKGPSLPIFFTIGMEHPIPNIKKKVDQGLLEFFSVNDVVMESHLMFANDVVIFSKADSRFL